MVVDDGSTDRSPELVQKYRDPRLRLIRQENHGPGFARNLGIKETTAPYLAFLDADDEWLPDFLNRYLEALKANPDCDYVVGPWFEGDPRFDRTEIWRKSGVEEGMWGLPANASHVDLHNSIMLHWTSALLCKRNVVEKCGGFYAKAKCMYGEDRYLQLQLLLNYKMYRFLEPLAWYHNETIGISSLGAGPRPLPPILMEPEKVRNNCPQPFREVLELYLASQALGFAQEYANVNDLSTALSLVRGFPLMKKLIGKYVKLLTRIGFAKVVALTGRLSEITSILM